MKTKFYGQKNMFKTDNKKFYGELGKPQKNVGKPPSKEEVETFWTSIWGTEMDYHEEAERLEREEGPWEGLEHKWDAIKVDEVKKSLRKAQNRKSPEIDKVYNFS